MEPTTIYNPTVEAQVPPRVADTSSRNLPTAGGKDDRILLRGGIVLTQDPAIGDFLQADILIEGKTILAIGPNLAHANAQVIDCTDLIIMPGFINTHHHQFYSAQRAIIPDGNLWGAWPQESYFSIHEILTTGQMRDANRNVIWDLGRSPYDPEDCYIAELVASANQINQGVTTGIDTSQCSHTPEHTDAMIDGLADSGRRTVYTYFHGRPDQPRYEFPGKPSDLTRGLGRLASRYFSSRDQLLTLALGTDHFHWSGFDPADIHFARSLNIPIVQHAGPFKEAMASGLLGPDMEFIHCTNLPSDTWQRIADAACHVSIAPIVEMQMGHGTPPFQDALDHGVLPSLSSDVETNMTADMFSIMRAAFSVQRMLLHHRASQGEQNLPLFLTCNQILRMATTAGAACAHLQRTVGSLTPGKEADIILLDRQAVNTAGSHNIPGAVVTLMDTSNVVGVFIAGKIKKWRARLVGFDVSTLAKRLEESRERILGRVKAIPIPVSGLHSAPGYSPHRFRSCCISDEYQTRGS